MKKILAAAAALTAAGATMAQSSVTLFGVIDAGVASVRSSGAGNVTGLLSGGHTTPRLGFRGVEDLGGGLSAAFWLEGRLNNDTGGGAGQNAAFNFTRRSTVSLLGPFGEVRLGRDFVASYPLAYTFDVTDNRGLGQIEIYGLATAGVTSADAFRASNAISYFLPRNLGGFYGQAQYVFGEGSSTTVAQTNALGLSNSAANAATRKTGDYVGGRFGYANGPVNVMASYGQYLDATRVVGAAAYAADFKVANFGASYDFGIVKIMGLVQTDRIDGQATIATFKFTTYSVGAVVPFGVSEVRAQVSRYKLDGSDNGANKASLGYVYNLSKRTALYAEAARLNNKGTARYQLEGISGVSIGAPTGGGSSTGYAVGVKHSF
jgi:predicted porin